METYLLKDDGYGSCSGCFGHDRDAKKRPQKTRRNKNETTTTKSFLDLTQAAGSPFPCCCGVFQQEHTKKGQERHCTVRKSVRNNWVQLFLK